MPDVAADSDEGVLAAWLVEESAHFDAAQTIAYVETQDELFSVEAGRPGMLVKTLIEPGTAVEPGTPIGILSEPWEQIHDLEAVLADLGLVRRDRVGASSAPEATAAGHRAEPPAHAFPAPDPLSVVAEVSPVVEEGNLAPISSPDEDSDEDSDGTLTRSLRPGPTTTTSARGCASIGSWRCRPASSATGPTPASWTSWAGRSWPPIARCRSSASPASATTPRPRPASR